MHNLPGELPWPAAATLSRQLVWAVGDEASLGLAARESFGTGAEVPQQKVDRLASVTNARFRAPEARIRLHSAMVERHAPKRIREPADPRREQVRRPLRARHRLIERAESGLRSARYHFERRPRRLV